MIVDLDVPFIDTGAADLRFVPDAPELTVLDSLELDGPAGEWHLSLRLLGASHQAVVTTPYGRYAETLACLPELGPAPPRDTRTLVGDMEFHFAVTVKQLSANDFAAAARREINVARTDPTTLLGRFPGHPHALTSLRAESPDTGNCAWRTVHAYPETGNWVTTCTSANAVAMSTCGGLLPSHPMIPSHTREKS